MVSFVFVEYPFREAEPITWQGEQTALPTSGNLQTLPSQQDTIPAEQAVTCFTPGTLVTTIKGKRPVEALRPGELLLTRDCGFQPLLWRGLRHRLPARATAQADFPVIIRAGALGHGQPERDMIVSPGHKVLSTDRELLRSLGETEALVEARTLEGLPGISRATSPAATYVHLLLDNHEIILTENTWTESFQLSRSTAERLARAGVDEMRPFLGGLDGTSHHIIQPPARQCLQVTELPLSKTA